MEFSIREVTWRGRFFFLSGIFEAIFIPSAARETERDACRAMRTSILRERHTTVLLKDLYFHHRRAIDLKKIKIKQDNTDAASCASSDRRWPRPGKTHVHDVPDPVIKKTWNCFSWS